MCQYVRRANHSALRIPRRKEEKKKKRQNSLLELQPCGPTIEIPLSWTPEFCVAEEAKARLREKYELARIWHIRALTLESYAETKACEPDKPHPFLPMKVNEEGIEVDDLAFTEAERSVVLGSVESLAEQLPTMG